MKPLPVDVGLDGQRAVAVWLRANGVRADWQYYHSPFDLDCSGTRVEVKTARERTIGGRSAWVVALHNKGVLDETRADVYILRLENFPMGAERSDVHLVVPSPIGKTALFLTTANINRWSKYINNLEPLRGSL